MLVPGPPCFLTNTPELIEQVTSVKLIEQFNGS